MTSSVESVLDACWLFSFAGGDGVGVVVLIRYEAQFMAAVAKPAWTGKERGQLRI